MKSKKQYIKSTTSATDIASYSPGTAAKIDDWLHLKGDIDDFIFYNFGAEDYKSEFTK